MKTKKRGQIELSFGMIFSIILIIIFLGFGIYAIIKFLQFQESIQISTFSSDFQSDVNKMWKSSQGSQVVTYTLPSKIISVCFVKGDKFQNMRFTSSNIIPGKMIENIDINKTTQTQSPLCILNTKGKVNFTIAKDYGENLVTIKK
ncbi:Uncharacterised protein [uncultured archaeon]|nr:Uncharacterised protein [uncultured archaeon]